MNFTKTKIVHSLLILFASLLSACGGGGGSAGSASTTAVVSSPAQGLWYGTTTTNRTVTNLVLNDGSYYVLYSPVGSPTAIAGVVQGTGSASAGTFTSSNTNDFNLEGLGVNAATMSVSYTAKQTFNGTVTYAVGGTSVFTTTYSTNYEAAPSLAAITGTFTGQVAAFTGGIQDAALTVSSTGVLSGGGGGCAITGLISPRTDGNAYNISIKFGAQPCMFTNQTIAGVAYFDAATKAIYVVAPNAGRTDGVIFVGSMAAAATAAGTLNSIAVTPGASIAVGSIQQLAATGTYVTPASTADVSTLVTWSSSNTAVATVSINGLVTGVAAGTAVITASKPGVVSAIANVTVTAATPAGSIIDPTLVGTWKRNASSLMRTFNVDGSFDMVSLYMNFGSCFSIYRMENIRYGVASTSGTALTLNTTGGTLKTWSCTYVYNALVPTTTSSVTPGTSSYTWRIVGSGVGATLYLNDGTGEDPYTKQ